VTKWSEVFKRSKTMPAVFLVDAGYQNSVYEWLEAQSVPVVESAGLYEPRITAWGVLDGGVSSTNASGFGSLRSGLRVFGWQTLRLLIAELVLEPPKRALPGEGVILDGAELQRRHQVADSADPEVERRATLLSCSDSLSLQWAVRSLFGDAALASKRAPGAPAHGQWGDAHFSQGAADLLDGRVPIEMASALAQGLQMRLPRDSPMSAKLNDYIQSIGIDQMTAERILQLEDD
jgi:hypothetical protein